MTQPKDKMLSHEMLGMLWESAGAYNFSINYKHYLCIVNYHSKLSVIKGAEGLITDNLIKHARLFLQNMDFPRD